MTNNLEYSKFKCEDDFALGTSSDQERIKDEESRKIELPGADPRGPFERDKARITYSNSFKRLIHKTQVQTTIGLSEHIRNRLTHSLEVANLACTIARFFGLNEDLTGAIALGHDIGHPPFGHAGERLLDNIITGKDDLGGKIDKDFVAERHLGFKHNYQSIRQLETIEKYVDTCKGLGLTIYVKEGILKHTNIDSEKGYEEVKNGFELSQKFSYTIEGQIVALSDEIIQTAHDIEDFVVFIANKYEDSYVYKDIRKILQKKFKININKNRPKAATRELIKILAISVRKAIGQNFEKLKNKEVVDEISYNDKKIKIITNELATKDVVFTDKTNRDFIDLREKSKNIYKNFYDINVMDGKAEYLIRRLFKAYITNPLQLPDSVLSSYTRIHYYNNMKQENEQFSKKSLFEQFGSTIFSSYEDFLGELKKSIDIIAKSNKHNKDDDSIINIRNLDPKKLNCLFKIIVNDADFLRVICDYIAGMTDRYAKEQFELLYL
jgi:dGTPase